MKLVREHINEKFTQESDPIEDMNIGIIAFLRKVIPQLQQKNLYELSMYFFGNAEYTTEAWFVLHILENIVDAKHSNYQRIFTTFIKQFSSKDEKIPLSSETNPQYKYFHLLNINKIAEGINNKFGFNMKNTFKIPIYSTVP